MTAKCILLEIWRFALGQRLVCSMLVRRITMAKSCHDEKKLLISANQEMAFLLKPPPASRWG
jgi:hypothetical protein